MSMLPYQHSSRCHLLALIMNEFVIAITLLSTLKACILHIGHVHLGTFPNILIRIAGNHGNVQDEPT